MQTDHLLDCRLFPVFCWCRRCWACLVVCAVFCSAQTQTLSQYETAGLQPAQKREQEASHQPAAKVPFVAAFERFGRHSDIAAQTAGELLIGELSCTACHASSEKRLSPKLGPQLHSVGLSIHPDWLRQYLTAPQSAKPGSTMPDVLSHLVEPQRTEVVNALVAYLSTQRAAFPTIKASAINPVQYEFWSRGEPQEGRRLFHETGCVACHAPEAGYADRDPAPSPLDRWLDELEPEQLAEMGLSAAARRVPSVPLPELAAKTTRQALAHFLFDPQHVRPAGRMPNMKLDTKQAADIAAYLLRTQDRSQPQPPPMVESAEPLIARGKEYFHLYRCINCHQTQDAKSAESSQFSRTLVEIAQHAERSCLASPRDPQPDFQLDAQQVVAIRTALDLLSGNGDKPDGLGEQYLAQQTLLRMNCLACHERDGLGGVGRFRKVHFETIGQVDLGDEGRLPPPLTGVGRKVLPNWLGRILKGDRKTELRTYMTIRMPLFSHPSVAQLASQFGRIDAANHRAGDQPLQPLKDREPLAKPGRELMDVGCVQCHTFDGEGLPGVLGIDLGGVTERVQPSWFQEFVLNPGAVKNRTRMPTFFPDGQSQNLTILDGDAQMQIAAMWSYLKHSQRLGPPEKIAAARAQDYELRPVAEPLLLRTFMSDVGTHAIAVGFPSGFHFAFDAQQPRMAIAWKGRFLDARSTWFERFAPWENPLGSDRIRVDPQVSLIEMATDPKDRRLGKYEEATDTAARFLGYRLDSNRTPTFLYATKSYEVEDRIDARDTVGLQRTIRAKFKEPASGPSTDQLVFRVLSGERIEQKAKHSANNEQGLTVEIVSGQFEAGRLQALNERMQWLVPISAGQPLQLLYRW